MRKMIQGLVRLGPPLLMVSQAVITKARRMAAIALSLALVMVLLSGAFSSVFAYRLFPEQWGFGKDSFTVCVRADSSFGFPSSTRRENIRSFINEWKNVSQADWSITISGDSVCSNGGTGYDIVVRKGDIGPAARTERTVIFGTNTIHAEVVLNDETIDNDRWWFGLGAEGECSVGSVFASTGCHMDAKTVIMHEFGHALGIDHNTSPANQSQECVKGYSPTNMDAACTPLGAKVMHWIAGIEFTDIPGAANPHQGYRHILTFDDKEALRDIYGDAP